jgi:hypothetical protein
MLIMMAFRKLRRTAATGFSSSRATAKIAQQKKGAVAPFLSDVGECVSA